MKQDFDSYLAEMENFLDCHLTEAEREQLKVRTKIDTMRQAAADREENVDMKERKKNFYRKGIVGDSKNYLKNNAELEIDLNKWIEVNLRGTDIDHSKWWFRKSLVRTFDFLLSRRAHKNEISMKTT